MKYFKVYLCQIAFISVLIISSILMYSLYLDIADGNYYDISGRKIVFSLKENNIDKLDSYLKESFGEFYKGYSHTNNISKGKLNNRKIDVFHLSENVSFRGYDYKYVGERIEFANEYDVLPIIVYGIEGDRYRINQKTKLSLYNKDGTCVEKDCVIVGKISMYEQLPHYERRNIDTLYSNAELLVIIPDIYRDAIFETNKATDKEYVLNFNDNDDDKFKKLTEAIKPFGITVNDGFPYYEPNLDITPIVAITLTLSFLSLIILYILMFFNRHYDPKTKLGKMFLIDNIVITLVSLFVVFFIKVTNINAHFILDYPYLLILLSVFWGFSVICKLIYYRHNKKQTFSEVNDNYERL